MNRYLGVARWGGRAVFIILRHPVEKTLDSVCFQSPSVVHGCQGGGERLLPRHSVKVAQAKR